MSGFLFNVATLSPSSGNELGRYDAEEELDNAIGPHAMFVAIGDKGPSYGSIKIIVRDQDWQETYRKLANAARLIFMMPGPTAAAMWELSQIDQSRELLEKTIFIMPREGSKLDIHGQLTNLMSLEHYRSPEAKEWSALTELFSSKLNAVLPRYDNQGGYFRMGSDGHASKILDLELFTHRLHRYLTHRKNPHALSAEEIFKTE